MSDFLPAKAISTPPPESGASRGRIGAARGYLARAAISLALIGVLFWHYGRGPLLSALAQERPTYFWTACIIVVAAQVVGAYRWQLVAGLAGMGGKFSEYCSYYFIGIFTNLFIPGLLGGDAARAAYLARRHKAIGKAAASVIADRMLALVALTWLAAASSALIGRSVFPWNVNGPILAMGVISFGLLLLSPALVFLIDWMPARMGALRDPLRHYLGNPRALVPAIGVASIVQVMFAVGQFVLGMGMGLKIPFSVFLLVVPVSNVFASIPVTLNGLGLRESAYLYLFRMVSVRPDTAIALGLLWFGALTASGISGALGFLIAGSVNSDPGVDNARTN